MTYLYCFAEVLRRFRSVSCPYMIASTRQLGELVSLRRFYASVYDHNFPSLVIVFFFWRSLVASTSSCLYKTINLRPPSMSVSSHISDSNAIASQSPAMPNVRIYLCTQNRFTLSPSHPVLYVQHPQDLGFDLLKNTSLLPVAPGNI